MAVTSTFVPFYTLMADSMNKVHNFSGDTIKLTLLASANAPNQATDAVLADLTAIDLTYLDDDTLTVLSSSTTGGVYRFILDVHDILASGGDLPTFRYIVLYNDTSTSDSLIGYLDYGSDITLSDGDKIIMNISSTNGILQETIS